MVGLVAMMLGMAGPAMAQLVITMPRAGEPAAPVSVMRVVHAQTDPRFDPWAALIREAALRFGIPEIWIREVMRQESGGNKLALSHAGAMGLMQVIPSTYATMRWKYGLGPNAWEPRDNILAGAAYIREMYDQYGFPGFLAAYNAGPGRVDGFTNRTGILPAETMQYLSILAPRLQGTTMAEGPLAAFLRPGAHAAQAPVLGPMLIRMQPQGSTPPGATADAMGLVGRGMLNGPQVVRMPAAGEVIAPVALPPGLVASMLRGAR